MSKDLTTHGSDRCNTLKTLKLAIQGLDVPEINFGNISKACALKTPFRRSFFSHAFFGVIFGSKNSSNIPLTKTPHLLHTIHIKPAAPLLACVIRWVFFCPASVAQKAEGVS